MNAYLINANKSILQNPLELAFLRLPLDFIFPPLFFFLVFNKLRARFFLSKIIIEAGSLSVRQRLKELAEYRELLWTLAYRDVRVRYAQTAVGFAWAIINPLLQILLLSFVFGTVAKTGTGESNVPHILYTTAGMCGWVYFSNVLSGASNSIIGAQSMVKKIYFPRLILPLSKALTAFIDLAVMLGIILFLMFIYGIMPTTSILFLPFFLFIAVISGLAVGIWLSALTIRFRDFKQITPLMLRLGMYATPIAYPASAVPEQYQLLFFLNPIAGVVEGVRWSLIGGEEPSNYILLSFGVVLILFTWGLLYFLKIERSIADII